MKKTGISQENIIISATHAHTGPEIEGDNEAVSENRSMLIDKALDASVMAVADIKPAKMGWNTATAPNIAFVRRFIMKDGSVQTNPGIGNSDILKPIGEVDESVSLLRFERENDSVLLVNFSNHPDVVGGSKISGDCPALTRRMIERCFQILAAAL